MIDLWTLRVVAVSIAALAALTIVLGVSVLRDKDAQKGDVAVVFTIAGTLTGALGTLLVNATGTPPPPPPPLEAERKDNSE